MVYKVTSHLIFGISFYMSITFLYHFYNFIIMSIFCFISPSAVDNHLVKTLESLFI